MARKTEEVFELVQDVLAIIPKPYGDDITDEVCQEIEKNTEWMRQYQNLCVELFKNSVNSNIGYYTKQITGKMSGRVTKAKSNLIKTYTKLV